MLENLVVKGKNIDESNFDFLELSKYTQLSEKPIKDDILKKIQEHVNTKDIKLDKFEYPVFFINSNLYYFLPPFLNNNILFTAIFGERSNISKRLKEEEILEKLSGFLMKVNNESLTREDIQNLYGDFFSKNQEKNITEYEVKLFSSALSVSMYQPIIKSVILAFKELIEKPEDAKNIKQKYEELITEKLNKIEEYRGFLLEIQDAHLKDVKVITPQELSLFKSIINKMLSELDKHTASLWLTSSERTDITFKNLNKKLE